MNTTHPLVSSYLDDLARMLADIDPGERDDILASVREHLDLEIEGPEASESTVWAALFRLGPPEKVAAEARRTSPTAVGTEPAGMPVQLTLPAPSPMWARVAVVTTMISTLPMLVVAFGARLFGIRGSGDSGGQGWPDSLGLLAPTGLELMVLAAPIWFIGFVCTLVGPGLTGATRTRLATAGPLAFMVMVVTASWESPDLLGDILLIPALAAATVWVAAVGRRAWREIQEG